MTAKRPPAHEVTDRPDDVGSPEDTVTAFLNAMQEGDVEVVIALAAEEIVYTNVSLPPMPTCSHTLGG